MNIFQNWLSDWNYFVNKLYYHFGFSDSVDKVANMLDNLHIKHSNKISTHNVNFIYYVSQLGWGNSVLYHYYYQSLPNWIHNLISTWKQGKLTLFQNMYTLAITIDYCYWILYASPPVLKTVLCSGDVLYNLQQKSIFYNSHTSYNMFLW